MLNLQVFMASCDLIAASLGACGCASSVDSEIEYRICAEQKISVEQAAPKDKPRKWCKYYSNGTIDVPTALFIEAYVYVGSRLCIGDRPPTTSGRSLNEDLKDQLAARSGSAIASWLPGGELEIDAPADFEVVFANKAVTAQLLGREATIRFTATRFRWVFSDGDRAFSAAHQKAFEKAEGQTAQAFVGIRVDYRFSDQPWVIGALEAEIPSNLLRLDVVEKPRRTLLVG
jgi:hypothetical protein